ncbi:hypothetical protein NJF44_08320 [Pseudomonas guariconensis]|uniref:hypothetical protein n=1 Tax=Pseudomonas TaxID=286 RepID=UPI001CE41C4B|nr:MULTISPECIES: hypothetical protein [Pseudomonas]MCO7514906.1 hypothetical protein [Pseudomonas putida]MCO7605243.1 hypothetical protein [Pseudomonas guariconensis]MCO7630481.1 hypothetical protein [Pseudomonas guariconensis]
MAYSLQDLLDALKEGDAMHGWGAILALGRDPVNEALQTRYVEAFGLEGMATPISGSYYIDESRTGQVTFDNVVLGPAQLSFKGAVGTSAKLKVTMELIAGSCLYTSMLAGNVQRFRKKDVLYLGMGYRFEIIGELKVVPNTYLRRSQVVLDLSAASEPTCTLGSTPIAAQKMGGFILEQLNQQLALSRPLPILDIDFYGNHALATVDFAVTGQQAPGDAQEGGASEDEGALLLLLQLVADRARGNFPSNLPYLLPPKDETSNYSAALLVSRERSPLVHDLGRSGLDQVLLPDAYEVRMASEHAPYDKILLGDVQAGDLTRQVRPAMSSMGAAQSRQFTVSGPAPLGWSARNVAYPRASGTMDTNGNYTTPAPTAIAGEQQIMLVSAQGVEDAPGKSALVVASADALGIAPRAVVWTKGQEPIRLTASEDGGTWSLVEAEYGTLDVEPADTRHALFTPDEPDTGEPIWLQRIQVRKGANTGYATVVIVSRTLALQVEPFHVAQLPSNGQQQFELIAEPQQLAQDIDWAVYGVGNIEDGLYRAGESITGEVSVIVGSIVGLPGFAVIEHPRSSARQLAVNQERWRELNHFKLTPNRANAQQVLANGRQQVGIRIKIETKPIETPDGIIYDPVSDLELSTLKLLHEDGTEIDWLPIGVEGLDPELAEGSGKQWAASKLRNRFDYLPVSTAGSGTDVGQVAGDNTRILNVYVHTLEVEPRNIKAKFQDHRNRWHFSDAKDIDEKWVEITGVKVPEGDRALYEFEPKRVEAKNGFDWVGEAGETDNFNYWHYTTHYWVLRSRAGLSFTDVRFDHCSMIRWESEQLAESFASYTGFAFKPKRHPDARPASTGIQYQAQLQLLALESPEAVLDYNFKGHETVSEGTLLLSLDRVPDWPFWYDRGVKTYRQVLDRPMTFTLLDNYGSPHRLKVSFELSGSQDHRNILGWDFQ